MSLLPTSIKGVLLIEGRAVLLRNERGEWELPGGRTDPGESHAETLTWEFREELSIDVQPLQRVDSYDLEVIPSRYVRIVTYGCRLRGQFRPKLSEEHAAFGLHARADLERLALPEGYRGSILNWSRHAGS